MFNLDEEQNDIADALHDPDRSSLKRLGVSKSLPYLSRRRHPLYSKHRYGVHNSLCNKKGLTCTYSKKRPNRPQRPSAERDHGDLVILPQAQSIKRYVSRGV